MQLQRTIGNEAVGRLFGTETRGRPSSQPMRMHTVQRNSGAQIGVQTKMAEITKLFRAELGENDDKEEETTNAYASEVAINGLCGGWVELFLQYPDWVEPVYNAVRTWDRPSASTDAEALLHFEKHLRKVTKFEGAENVVKLLRDAYEAMSRLEPTAGYDNLPLWTDDVDPGGRPLSPTADSDVKTDESTFRLRKRNGAKLVCAKVAELTASDKPGECMAHIESDIHHMALRVQKVRRKGTKLGLVITVVETEKRGIVKVESLAKAEPILNEWLAKDEPDLQTITVRTRTTGF
jgi:hypothetical protein